MEVPSQQNFIKCIREKLKDNFERFVRYYKPKLISGVEDRVYPDDLDDFDEHDDLRTSVTRFFKIKNLSEEEFINKVHEIDQSRYVH